MLKFIFDILFTSATVFISIFIIAWYMNKSEEKEPFPYERSTLKWIFHCYRSPFKTVNTLFSNETDKESNALLKDCIGFVLFSFVVFITSNFLYYRGEFFTIETFFYYIFLTAIFFLARLIFITYTIFKHKNIFRQFQQFNMNEKAFNIEKAKLEQSRILLNKRLIKVDKIHNKWKKTFEEKQSKQLNLEQSIEQEKERVKKKYRTLVGNLDTIHSLDPNTIIAVDSNILMKGDNYIIKAISQFPILISKRVQQEWDKNKQSDHGQKAFRARQAIRRLVELPNYSFTVSK